MPVELYRSLQYRLESTKKKQQQKEIFENEQHNQMINNSHFSLPRGPIIQLDLRPKSAAYFNMLRKSEKLSKSAIDESFNLKNDLNSQKRKKEEIENFVETIENIEDLNYNNDVQKRIAYSNIAYDQANRLKFNDQERTNNQAMEQLENKIKRWHLDLGCNKACVAKFNRIDVNVRFFRRKLI